MVHKPLEGVQYPQQKAEQPRQLRTAPIQYVLQGESLDTAGDVMYAQRMLQKTRGMRKAPDVRKSVAIGRQYFGKLEDQHGLLPTEVTKKRKQGKQAAKPYVAPPTEFVRTRVTGKKAPAQAARLK